MSSFRCLALVLALSVPAAPVLLAQSSSSSSNPDGSAPAQAQSESDHGGASVQARLRARREQRRAMAIHQTYDYKWEGYVNMGYMRYVPGPQAQKLTFYAWDTGMTRYLNERLGVNLDARGNYGYAFIGPNFSSITRPEVSLYTAMAGPVYRFYVQPRYSVSGRVMAGFAHNNNTGDTGGFQTVGGLLYPNTSSYAADAAVIGDWNIMPEVSLRLAPEYFFTGAGGHSQADRGFSGGIVFRFGKQ